MPSADISQSLGTESLRDESSNASSRLLQNDDHPKSRIRHVLSPDFIRFINSTYTGSVEWTFESERVPHGHSASDSEEIERLRHLHPHRWIHSGSNISIASSMPG